MPSQNPNPSNTKNIILYILVFFLLCTVVFSLYFFVVEQSDDSVSVSKEDIVDFVPEDSQEPPSRMLSGKLMDINPAGEYIRISVQGEAVYSVGIPQNLDISQMALMSDITVEATPLDSTERYDYLANTESVKSLIEESKSKSSTGLTVDERIERLKNLTPNAI